MYDPTIVSNNILSRSFRDDIPVTNLALQKMLYFVGSEYAKATGYTLYDADFETWTHGPVLRPVYNEFKAFGRNRITTYSRDALDRLMVADEASDPVLKEILDRVWRATNHLQAWELREATHLPGSAWDAADKKQSPTLSFDDVRADETYRALVPSGNYAQGAVA